MPKIVSIYDLLYDDETDTLATIDIAEQKINAGNTFVAHHRYSTLGDEGKGEIYFKPPASTVKRIHMVASFSSELLSRYEIRESATVSVSGTALIAYNKDRDSAESSTCLIRHTPTLTASGIAIDGEDITLGRTARAKWKMKSGTVAIFRLISEAASNSGVVRLEWSEHLDET